MKAIHLCIDMQERERDQISKFTREPWNHIKRNITCLVKGLDGLDVPTMYVALLGFDIPLACGTLNAVREHLSSINGPNVQAPGTCIDFSITPQTLIGLKSTYSAYESQPIRRYIEDNDFDTVILSGVWEARNKILEKHCVSMTAESFAKEGYNTIIAAEATDLTRFRNFDYCSPAGMKKRQGFYNSPNLRVLPISGVVSVLTPGMASTRPVPVRPAMAGAILTP